MNPDQVPDGYVKFFAINPFGQKDEFYFNYEGYQRPEGDAGRRMFWSSSIPSNRSYFAYALNGNYGAVYWPSRGDYRRDLFIAVLCVPSR